MFVLGDVQFKIPALTPESEEYSRSHTYAEMKPVNGRPILQRKGANLTETNVSMYFHYSFCRPAQQIESLMNAMDSGLICPYFWEDGVFKGNYVILNVKVKVEKRFPDGELMAATVDVSLREYSEAQFLHSVEEEFATVETPDPETEVAAPVNGAGAKSFDSIDPSEMARQ